jgi:hypothetical protein
MIRTAGYLFWRLCRITCGFLLLLVGIMLSLPGIPGPGIVLIVLSLGILSHDFHWAHRVNVYLKRKWHEVLDRRNYTAAKKETNHG